MDVTDVLYWFYALDKKDFLVVLLLLIITWLVFLLQRRQYQTVEQWHHLVTTREQKQQETIACPLPPSLAIQSHSTPIRVSNVSVSSSNSNVTSGIMQVQNLTVNENQDVKEPPADLNAVLCDMQAILRKKYKHIRISGLPWLPEMSLEKIFVNLTLTERGTKLELTELFNCSTQSDKPVRILVEGGPGYGKTTLAHKLCYDWVNNVEYMSRFDLVIVLQLRRFKDSFKQILIDTLEVDSVWSTDVVLQTIDKNATKTLLVLEGYDEASVEAEKSFNPILRGDQLKNITVLITSRPGKFMVGRIFDDRWCRDATEDFCVYIVKKITIIGLLQENQQEFLEKHLKHLEGYSPQQLASVRDHLEKMVPPDFLACPLFILMLAFVFRDGNIQKITSKTELFKLVINYIVQRFVGHTKADVFKFDVTNLPEYVTFLSALGEVSISAFEKDRLVFSQEELLGLCDDKEILLKIGLLNPTAEVNGVWSEIYYEPVHKSLLEFLAAYHLWIVFLTKPDNFETIVYSKKSVRPTQETISSLTFPFLCGLFEKKCPVVLQCLTPFVAEYSYWFGSLCYSLQECIVTDDIIDSLNPLFPVEWQIPWYESDRSFAMTAKHQMFLQYALHSRKTEVIRWFLDSPVLLPNVVRVNVLILVVGERHPIRPFKESKNRSIQCSELWCDLRTPQSCSEDWKMFMEYITCIKKETIAFLLCTTDSYLWLPFVHQSAISNCFGVPRIQRLHCWIKRKQKHTLSLITELIQTENLVGLNLLVIPSSLLSPLFDKVRNVITTLLAVPVHPSAVHCGITSPYTHVGDDASEINHDCLDIYRLGVRKKTRNGWGGDSQLDEINFSTNATECKVSGERLHSKENVTIHSSSVEVHANKVVSCAKTFPQTSKENCKDFGSAVTEFIATLLPESKCEFSTQPILSSSAAFLNSHTVTTVCDSPVVLNSHTDTMVSDTSTAQYSHTDTMINDSVEQQVFGSLVSEFISSLRLSASATQQTKNETCSKDSSCPSVVEILPNSKHSMTSSKEQWYGDQLPQYLNSSQKSMNMALPEYEMGKQYGNGESSLLSTAVDQCTSLPTSTTSLSSALKTYDDLATDFPAFIEDVADAFVSLFKSSFGESTQGHNDIEEMVETSSSLVRDHIFRLWHEGKRLFITTPDFKSNFDQSAVCGARLLSKMKHSNKLVSVLHAIVGSNMGCLNTFNNLASCIAQEDDITKQIANLLRLLSALIGKAETSHLPTESSKREHLLLSLKTLFSTLVSVCTEIKRLFTKQQYMNVKMTITAIGDFFKALAHESVERFATLHAGQSSVPMDGLTLVVYNFEVLSKSLLSIFDDASSVCTLFTLLYAALPQISTVLSLFADLLEDVDETIVDVILLERVKDVVFVYSSFLTSLFGLTHETSPIIIRAMNCFFETISVVFPAIMFMCNVLLEMCGTGWNEILPADWDGMYRNLFSSFHIWSSNVLQVPPSTDNYNFERLILLLNPLTFGASSVQCHTSYSTVGCDFLPLSQLDFDSLIHSASQSEQLTNFAVTNFGTSPLTLRVDVLCNYGHKGWRELKINGEIKLYCGSDTSPTCKVDHLDVRIRNNIFSTEKFLRQFYVDSLHCNEQLVTNLTDKIRDFTNNIKELKLYLTSPAHDLVSMINSMQQLQTLALTITAFEENSDCFCVQDILPMYSVGFKLKRLEIWNVNTNPKLGSRVIEALADALMNVDLDCNTTDHQLDCLMLHLDVTIPSFRTVTSIMQERFKQSKRLADVQHIKLPERRLLELVSLLKRPLRAKRIPSLELVCMSNPPIWEDIFPSNEGYVIKHCMNRNTHHARFPFTEHQFTVTRT